MGETTDELRRQIEEKRSDLGETVEAIGDRVMPGRVIERRKNQISGGFRSVADRFVGTAQDVQHAVGDAAGSVHGAPGAVRSQTQGAPLLTGALALAAGFLAAVVFPASEAEKRASGQLMDKVEPVKAELASVGQEVADHLKEPAKQAVEEVKAVATDGVDAVKDTAKDAAEQTTAGAKDAAEAIKSGQSEDDVAP
jgi:gas vesicle protein